MSEYSAPLADINFMLNHVVSLSDISKLPGYEHAEPDMIAQVLDEAAKLAHDVLDPINRSGDEEGATLENGVVTTPKGFKEAYAQYCEGGWNGAPFDPELGGGGLPWSVTMALGEMWNGANLGFSLCTLLNQGSVEAIEAHGTEEQKSTYLEKMISGEWSGTMNLTEPGAGSDVGALKSKAEPAGDGTWRIKGQKIFITYGEHDFGKNIIHLVLARTPGSPAGTKGISLFIVPKFLINEDGSLGQRNDLRCIALEEKLGIHSSPTCVMSYGDNDECVGYMIGAENKGMSVMFTMMNNARLSVGVQGIGVSERAYQHAVAYATERVQGRPAGESRNGAIIGHADVRRNLMTMRALTEASRAICLYDAECLDIARHSEDRDHATERQAMAELLTPISKSFCTDSALTVTSIGVQVHGGMGFIEETGAAQYYRDCRILPIYEGTNGIQALDLVMRKLPMHGGAAFRSLMDEVADTITRATDSNDTRLQSIGQALAVAAQAAADGAIWLTDTMAEDVNDAAAGATPFQDMMGLVVGAHLLGRAALAAEKLLAQGGQNKRFLSAKIDTAFFFATQLLPKAPALLPAVKAGAAPLYAVSEDALIA